MQMKKTSTKIYGSFIRIITKGNTNVHEQKWVHIIYNTMKFFSATEKIIIHTLL